jgi:pyrimidine-nucleoside phosphorylase
MRIIDIIAAKRDGRELTSDDISHIILGYTNGEVADYQMSAFLMVVFFKGMSFTETSAMTKAMVESGAVLDLSAITGTKVDKHSTGGVGDKTTLVVVPILASCGLKVPKMSGRGLGFTGGTLDKLESIPGFDTALSPERLIRQVNEIGAAIAGQSQDVVPADKKIYALRDVTATVESIPLIAASIMSKKIACSSDVILLDVKVGSGAFMHDLPRARELAQTMIAIGTNLGRKVGAVITDMNQPLGYAVGNALEVAEAIDTLQGSGPSDFRQLCVELSAIILYMSGQCGSLDDSRVMAASSLESGTALDKFTEIISAQNGSADVISDTSLLPKANYVKEVISAESGIVSEINCAQIGQAASILGAGRERKEDSIDLAAGIVVKKKIGDRVDKGEPLAVLHTNNESSISEAEKVLKSAYTLSESASIPTLIYEMIY